MKLGIMFPNVLADCKETGLVDELKKMADAGLYYLQARPQSFADGNLAPTPEGRDALNALGDLGIEIVGWCGYNPLIGKDDAVAKSVETIKKSIQFAAAAREISDKARPIVFSESGNPAQHSDLTYEHMWAQIVSAVKEIADEARKNDAIFAFEPTRANILDSSKTTVKLIREVGSDRVKSLFDPANICGDKDTIEGAVKTLKPYMILAHAKDVILKGEGGRPEYPPAGKGDLDYPRIFDLLKPIETCREIIIEYVRTPEQARETIQFLRQFCE
ncbi:MAG: sugar phosphate isomerase/epimerase family protein [Planctomycetota bacterium]